MPRKPRPKLETVVPVVRREKVRVEPLEPATWRVITTAPSDGATNMAIDEAIATAVAQGKVPPTLRFYEWDPPCLSLGYSQPIDTADEDACAKNGWDIVRRQTGGRAILHIDELTYSIATPDAEPRVKGGVLESYRRLSAGLYRGLKQIGLEAERAQPYYTDAGEQGPACFDGPSDYEITVGQRKLIGSAQKRQSGVVLQHGTIPLAGDITRICDALNLSSGQRFALRNRLRFRATTLESCLGTTPPDTATLIQALSSGFSQSLNLTLKASSLTPEEQTLSEQLHAEKYASSTWLTK